LLLQSSGQVNGTGYYKIAIETILGSSGVSPFANNDLIYITFAAIGTSGYSGYSGYSGVSGYSGFSGVSGYSGFSGLSGYSGFSGLSGKSGYSGFSGLQGNPGGAIIVPYAFSTSVAVDPAAGTLRLSDTQLVFDHIYADQLDANGDDRTVTFAYINSSTAFDKGLIRLWKASDPTKWLLIRVTSVTDNSGWFDLEAPLIESSEASPFVNGDAIYLSFDKAGDTGPTGISGFSGFSGVSGAGISGYSGFSGVSGYSGYSSTSGYSGFSGKSAYSGFSGVSAYSGFSGVSGYSGYSGIISLALNDGLTAFWKLEEVSGTRVDSFGTNHLSDFNTVTQAVGKIGNAAQFTKANGEYLFIADNSDVSTGDIDFTIAVWVYLDSKPVNQMDIITKRGASVGVTEYILRYEGSAIDRFTFWIGGPTFISVTANNFGVPSLSTWYFIVAWHDAAANTINIRVNNGTADSVTTGGQVVPDTSSELRIGSDQSGLGDYWDGRIDAVGFWKRVLTADEQTDLYNNNNGLEAPFPAARGFSGYSGYSGFSGVSGAAVDTITVVAAPGSDVTATGIKAALTAGENLVFGDVCYIKSDGKAWKADANVAATFPCVVMALATIAANASGSFLLYGIARNDAWAWTVGGVIYLSTAAGSMTQTQPSATDDVIQALGIGTHADRMLFNPDLIYITHT
jgi:hypothetical protein